MKKIGHIFFLFFGLVFLPQWNYAQVDFNKTPDDDLGNVEDQFQDYFYEALKQKGIENYERSNEALLKCIELNDEPAVLYFELGKNYNKLKNFGLAEESLKKAVDKDPDNEWFLDELYGFYAAQNNYDGAIKTIKQLVKYHPDYKEDLAALYFRTKDYKEAIKLLDELDKAYGISSSRDVLRNKIYKATGQKKDQIENLEQRVEDNPNKEANYLALIYRYSENNQKEKAFETAKELLDMNPNSQLVHLALYKFYLDDDDPERAIESMKIVLKSTQIKPDAKLKVLSDFVKFVNKHPEFETELVEAITLAENHSDQKTLEELGQYYLAKGNKEKALSYFESVLNLDHDNYHVLQNVLLLKLDLKQFEQVREQSAQALLKYPSQPLFYLINGTASLALNDLDKAIEVLEEGVDYIIDDTKMEIDFYTQLSKAYTLQSNFEKAKTLNDKVKQLQISN
ncbi:tetratricopeptide repeat protein [Aestuariivivens sediminis]|uniref:tetratricopeptide repeat protein n=1 Tax=Aestuariivivens sediminis TaxID=2913557 RepID=UPI001F5AA4BA|nr:tetratricopeptide repeat protein [Aestuariivivens sediminis]